MVTERTQGIIELSSAIDETIGKLPVIGTVADLLTDFAVLLAVSGDARRAEVDAAAAQRYGVSASVFEPLATQDTAALARGETFAQIATRMQGEIDAVLPWVQCQDFSAFADDAEVRGIFLGSNRFSQLQGIEGVKTFLTRNLQPLVAVFGQPIQDRVDRIQADLNTLESCKTVPNPIDSPPSLQALEFFNSARTPLIGARNFVDFTQDRLEVLQQVAERVLGIVQEKARVAVAERATASTLAAPTLKQLAPVAAVGGAALLLFFLL